MIDKEETKVRMNEWSEILKTLCHRTTKIIIVRCIIEKENNIEL